MIEGVRPPLRLVEGEGGGAPSRAESLLDHPSRALVRRPALYIGSQADAAALLTQMARRRERIRFLVTQGGR
ncbi:MAG TPA: hypothetical protein VNC61_14975 [Acidimicrobiales bacterium]|nr:hypothetical protein [Acidimicrobiales bacterium]